MNLVLVNGPAVEPVSLDDMKLYLRLDGDAEDTLVSAMISAARMTVEAATNLALLEQSWRLRMPSWQAGAPVISPIRPLLRLEAVRCVSREGDETIIESEDFRIDAGIHAVIALGQPPKPSPGGHIEIDLTLGHGSLATDVPEALRLAVRTLVANWFDNRGEAPVARGAPMLPEAVLALLAPFRALRLA